MAALMGMVREQDLFIALGPAIDYIVTARRAAPIRTVVVRAIAGLATFFICFLPQLVAYQVLFGRPSPSPYVEQKMTWTSPHAWRVITSPENGLLFWTPLALAALAGLGWLASPTRRAGERTRGAGLELQDPPYTWWVAFVCVVMVLSQIYVGGSLDTWAGAGSFGQRRLIALTIFFVIGLAALWRTPRAPMRHAVHLFVALAVWWNLGLIAQFATGIMDRQHLDVRRNAYDNFVTIPRELPGLAYRFAFDRRSFYQNNTPSTR